jgi:hypothetical protein
VAGYRVALWLSTIAFLVGALAFAGSLIQPQNPLAIICSLIVLLGSLSLIRGLRLRLGLRYDARHS